MPGKTLVSECGEVRRGGTKQIKIEMTMTDIEHHYFVFFLKKKKKKRAGLEGEAINL